MPRKPLQKLPQREARHQKQQQRARKTPSERLEDLRKRGAAIRKEIIAGFHCHATKK